MSSPQIYLLIPAFNESAHLGELLRQIQSVFPVSRVLVIDDGSTDKTSQLASDSGAAVQRHEVNCGKGKALDTGFRYLMNHEGADAVITMDADLQHDPIFINSFIEMYAQNNFDLIVGWRSRKLRDMPVSRILTNSATSFLLSIRSGLHIRDSQCGFRLLSRNLLENIHTDIRGFQAETEIILKAVLSGFKVGFLPISTIYTTERSYIKPARDVWDFMRIYGRSFFWNI